MVYVELHCQPNGRWLEEIEEFECTQQSERLAAIELALISAGAVLTIAAMAAIAIVGCKILNK